MAKTERPLPDFVQQEFESYLKCGRLEHGFLRVQCQLCKHEDLVAFSCKKRGFCPSCGAKRMVEHAALLVDEILPAAPYRQWVLSVPFQLRFLFASKPEVMSKALGIVYRTIATHLIHTAGHTHDTAHTGAITFIQRFGSALNLNVHFHMLFLDGVYVSNKANKLAFKPVNAPTKDQLQAVVQRISERLTKLLTRQGLLTQDDDSSTLTLDALDDNALHHLQSHSVTYRVAVGPQQGKKVFTLQTIPAQEPEDDRFSQVGKVDGFSLKPDVMSKALGIVYRTIATHLIHTAGHTHDTAHAGAITFIQRFGSALNLNVHLMCRDARMSRAHGCAGATMARLASSTSSMLGPGVRQIRKVEAPKPSQTCMFIARSNENSPQSGLCKSEGRSRPPHFGVATRACPLGRPLRRPQKRASSLTT